MMTMMMNNLYLGRLCLLLLIQSQVVNLTSGDSFLVHMSVIS